MNVLVIVALVIFFAILALIIGVLLAIAATRIRGATGYSSDPNLRQAELYLVGGAILGIAGTWILGLITGIYIAFAWETFELTGQPFFIFIIILQILQIIALGTMAIAASIQIRSSKNFKFTGDAASAYEFAITSSVLSVGILGIMLLIAIMVPIITHKSKTIPSPTEEGEEMQPASQFNALSNINPTTAATAAKLLGAF
jgi:hypothetical protein